MADGYPIKLVRDNMAIIDRSEGLRYRRVESPDEHRRRLHAKLVEEVGEYLIDPSVNELSDILEAIKCLAWVDCGVNFDAVEAAAAKKFDERGGFREGTVMETIEPCHAALVDSVGWPTVPSHIAGTDGAKPWIEGRDAAIRAAMEK